MAKTTPTRGSPIGASRWAWWTFQGQSRFYGTSVGEHSAIPNEYASILTFLQECVGNSFELTVFRILTLDFPHETEFKFMEWVESLQVFSEEEYQRVIQHIIACFPGSLRDSIAA